MFARHERLLHPGRRRSVVTVPVSAASAVLAPRQPSGRRRSLHVNRLARSSSFPLRRSDTRNSSRTVWRRPARTGASYHQCHPLVGDVFSRGRGVGGVGERDVTHPPHSRRRDTYRFLIFCWRLSDSEAAICRRRLSVICVSRAVIAKASWSGEYINIEFGRGFMVKKREQWHVSVTFMLNFNYELLLLLHRERTAHFLLLETSKRRDIIYVWL